MPKAAHDWDICATCTHTIQVHMIKGELGPCHGYDCDCKEFILKK